MKQLRAIFHGYVQGIGFRYSTERISRQYGVTGYVRNLRDGTVEVTAEGEEKELQEFLQAIRDGPLGPHILEMETDWREATGQWRNFTIKI